MSFFRSLRSHSLLFTLLCALGAPAVQAQVVISQVYGGGGNAGATYKNDFIELFNRGSVAVDLTGWSVQYGAATGTTWAKTDLTAFTLQPGQYYLVQEAVGAGGTVDLPTPNATGTLALSATAGKVALVSTGVVLTGACPTGGAIVDFVGFGSTANCYEGTAATPPPSNTTGVLRAANGCTETNVNSADFTAVAPTPRNSSSALNPCGAAPTLSIGNSSPLPAAQQGQPYSASFTPSGGSGPYTFSLDSGTLPPGLTLSSGVLSGTPTSSAGSPYSFTIRLTDSTSATVTKTFSLTVNAVATCAPTQTIAQIQGSGSTSPVVTQSVTTSGIVTALRSNGFFLQMPVGDGDPNTSDGIFVFTSSAPPAAAAIGNSVCVTGTVAEFAPSSDPNSPTQTEIGSPTVFSLSTGNALPAPVAITAADASPSGPFQELEKFEGMRVTVNSLTVVAPTRGNITESSATATSTGIFSAVVTGVPRPFREPGVQVPDPLPAGAPATVTRFDANPEILTINTVAQPGGTALNVGTGTVITGVVGVVDFANRQYTIDVDPSATLNVTPGSLTYTAVPVPTANELTVGTFNMERFFDTVDDPGISDVALTATAFANRLNKASLAIRNVLRYPDILAVEEMENLSTLQAVATKVNNDAVTAGDPNPNYQPYLVEGNDVGGIDVGFLVKTPKVTVTDVTQYGKTATYIDPGTNAPALLNDRPPLVLRATATASGSALPLPIIVIANHLRSLTSIDDPADGARVRAKREAQAEYLANLIQTLGNGNPNINIVSVGDYNAFNVSDGYVDVLGVIKGTPVPASQVVTPPAVITTPALTDLIDTLPADQKYSYTFDGSAQALDHILVNPSANAKVTRFAYGRMDADFPEIYRNDASRPEKLSDHDPAVAYFALPVVQAPVATNQTVSVVPNGPVAIPLTVSDPAGSALTFALTTPAAKGGVTFSNSSKVAIYGPAPNSTGTDSFTYTATNPSGLTATATVTINFVGPGPLAAVRIVNPSLLATYVGAQFPTPFQASVTDANFVPLPNIPVTFTIVPGGGASATFPGGATTATVSSDTSGIATAPAITANSVAGTFTITASSGAFSSSKSLTNIALPAALAGTKIGIFRSSGAGNVLWVRDRNGDGLYIGGSGDTAVAVGNIGTAGDQPLIGDWSGTGTQKLGVYRPFGSTAAGAGLFVLDADGNEQFSLPPDKAQFYAPQAGDIAVVGHWNGGTVDRAGFFRNGAWFLDTTGDGSFSTIVAIGQPGDVPIVGDWNGDGRTKVGAFRGGLWILDYNGNGIWDGPTVDRAFYIGGAGDQPVVGDWNGDGRTKVGVFRKGASLWVLDYNGNGQWDGIGTDRALFTNSDTSNGVGVVGDWTNTGRTKTGVFNNGSWALDVNGDGSFSWFAYIGQAGDTPIVGKW